MKVRVLFALPLNIVYESYSRKQKGFKQTPERKNTIANERWGKTNVESGNTFKKTIVIL